MNILGQLVAFVHDSIPFALWPLLVSYSSYFFRRLFLACVPLKPSIHLSSLRYLLTVDSNISMHLCSFAPLLFLLLVFCQHFLLCYRVSLLCVFHPIPFRLALHLSLLYLLLPFSLSFPFYGFMCRTDCFYISHGALPRRKTCPKKFKLCIKKRPEGRRCSHIPIHSFSLRLFP